MGKVAFTAGRVNGFKPPPGKAQAFLWDATAPGLGLRVTPGGKPAYVFQSVFAGKSVRITIGEPTAWAIPQAQAKARELQREIDEGRDPRGVKREALAAEAAQAAKGVTTAEAWTAYIKDRTPQWGERHLRDHQALARAGGEKPKRGIKGGGLTTAGPLHSLLALPLRDLTPQAVEAWAVREAQTRPTQARLALRCLKAFLAWCGEQPSLQPVVQAGAAKTRRAREVLGKSGVKSDALLREQLPTWFSAVQGTVNPTVAAYLQTLLLTGARPGEVLAMRWDDLNTQWRGLTIRDKVEGERVIPLTPYVHHLLAALPRRNAWVFASSRLDLSTPIAHPTEPHKQACKVAGLEGLTLHGLRRSFKSLTEWLDIPAGVVAQIMGHKPSATAEKHYTVRPLDLLRVHHERIEAWILEQAGVSFDAQAAPGALRVVG